MRDHRSVPRAKGGISLRIHHPAEESDNRPPVRDSVVQTWFYPPIPVVGVQGLRSSAETIRVSTTRFVTGSRLWPFPGCNRSFLDAERGDMLYWNGSHEHESRPYSATKKEEMGSFLDAGRVVHRARRTWRQWRLRRRFTCNPARSSMGPAGSMRHRSASTHDTTAYIGPTGHICENTALVGLTVWHIFEGEGLWVRG